MEQIPMHRKQGVISAVSWSVLSMQLLLASLVAPIDGYCGSFDEMI
jgi:hypothetical protein